MKTTKRKLLKASGPFLAALIASVSPSFGQDVNVTNSTANPVNVKEVRVPGTSPLQFVTSLSPQSPYYKKELFVPAGRLAVIEHASFIGCFAGNTDVFLGVTNNKVTVGAPNVGMFLGRTSVPATFGGTAIRLYLAAGAKASAAFLPDQPGTCGTAELTVTGHWEDVPLDVIILPRN